MSANYQWEQRKKFGADALRWTDIIFMNMSMKDKPKPRVYLFIALLKNNTGFELGL